MTGLTLTTLPARAARPTVRAAAPQAPITPAEATRIADAFPARPAVAQTLYGPGRQVSQAAPLGARIDLSA